MEKSDNNDSMGIHSVDGTDRARKGFSSSGTGLELKETQPMIGFVQADGNHQFYDSPAINQHRILCKRQVLLSNTIITKAILKGFEGEILAQVSALADMI